MFLDLHASLLLCLSLLCTCNLKSAGGSEHDCSKRGQTFITEFETGLSNILERNTPANIIMLDDTTDNNICVNGCSLPLPKVLEQDLVQRISKEENLVTTGVKFLDEDTVHQAVGRLPHIGDVEDLTEI